MTVRCIPFARIRRDIEPHQTGAPRAHGREHCRFETGSALKRGANIRRSPLAQPLTRPFTIGPDSGVFVIPAVSCDSVPLHQFGNKRVRKCLKTSSVALRLLLRANYSHEIVWSREIRASSSARAELILAADPGKRASARRRCSVESAEIHTPLEPGSFTRFQLNGCVVCLPKSFELSDAQGP